MTDGTWACSRCGQANERIKHPPWPGELGQQVKDHICTACWQEWMGVQTKIINEYRLNVLEPEHANVLKEQMQVFLGLESQDEASG
jgi:Fe-S cluster biosynthesis and repair protein YggX